MSDRFFDRAVTDWLESGSDRTPPAAIDAVLLAVKTTPQERDLRVPRRFTPMTNTLRLAAGIAIAALLGAGTLYLYQGPGFGSSTPLPPTPTAAPSATTAAPSGTTVAPSPRPNPLLDTANWTPYTSAQYGFRIGYPKGWTVEPADHAWDFETDAANVLSSAADSFYTPGSADGLGVRLSAWSVPFEYANEQTWEEVQAWIQTYCEATESTTCASIDDRAVRLCIEIRDCHPGLLLASSDSDTQAFFSGGFYAGRMVVLSMWRSANDPAVAPYGGGRQLLEAFLSTMCVWPEDARPSPALEQCLAID